MPDFQALSEHQSPISCVWFLSYHAHISYIVAASSELAAKNKTLFFGFSIIALITCPIVVLAVVIRELFPYKSQVLEVEQQQQQPQQSTVASETHNSLSSLMASLRH